MTHSTVTADSTTDPATGRPYSTVVRSVLRVAIAGLALLTVLSFLGHFRYAFDLLSHFRVHILVAAAFVTLVLVAMRDRYAIVLAVMVLAANAAGLWPRQTAATAAADPEGRALTLVTFNIWASNTDVDAIAAYLLETNADVVVVQEFWLQRKKLKQLLKSRYPWQADCRRVAYCDIAMFSKKPWAKTGILNPGSARAPALWATFGTGGNAITIASAHFDRPPSLRHKRQLDSMATWLRKQNVPVIFASDFNATPWSWAMTNFRRKSGLDIVPGYRPTWPAHLGFAQLPIDHILVSPGIKSVTAERGRAAGSDHLPVKVKLSLP